MIRPVVALVLLAAAHTAFAMAPWQFGAPVVVAPDDSPHYHHLDGAGRQHIAASAAGVAIAWEDDRSGAPQVYLATKAHGDPHFARTLRLSTGKEAYEPAVVAVDRDRWLVAWEQDGDVVACLADGAGQGPVTTLARDARQVTLAAGPGGHLAAAWARDRPGGQWLEAADIGVSGRDLHVSTPRVVAPLDDHPFQAYPALAWSRHGDLLVAWEDRRAGHTRLFHTWRQADGGFAPERQLNQHFAPSVPGEGGVGLGTGVMRVMLAADADGVVRTVWLDKRNAASGYAVWGAMSRDGGRTFGPNRIVQDELGAAVAQWHAALAGGRGGFVAAWDDTREGWGNDSETGDVLLSWTAGETWSADLVVPGASGDGYQGSPAVALDPDGDLHLVWIARADLNAPTRLNYLRGTVPR